jgi:hypothetical protein
MNSHELTREQSAILKTAEAAGRLAWFILGLKNAKAEQYLRPRSYRVNPHDFKGNGYVEYLTRLANRKEQDPR